MDVHTHTVHTHIVATLTEKFEIPADRLGPTTTLEELGMDSLAVVELYVTLQDHWNIPLDDGQASSEVTVDELVHTVVTLLVPQPGEPGPGAV
ncbi:acyl carrier protein [Streptomyces sp. NPDC051567]|uniref:acyl carrier protein n=1 Tax=Streptomyces sp. NPDC051567 TaxID=3365660 RepID=UPI0037ACA411